MRRQYQKNDLTTKIIGQKKNKAKKEGGFTGFKKSTAVTPKKSK